MMNLDLFGGGVPVGVDDDLAAIQAAATNGIRGLEALVERLSQPDSSSPGGVLALDCREKVERTIAKFRKVISMLDRTGHARFRRGPVPPVTVSPWPAPAPAPAPQQNMKVRAKAPPALPEPPKSLTLDFTLPAAAAAPVPKAASKLTEGFSISPAMCTSGTTSSFISSLTAGEDSVTKSKPLYPSAYGAQRLRVPLKRKFNSVHSETSAQLQAVAVATAAANGCHCPKRRRKDRARTTIRVRAISEKDADVPADDYSWRKYGQKPIKGSPFPRGYYRCSTLRGCPARKHVERDPSDPTMLIVTYEDDHYHFPATSSATTGAA